MRLLHELGYACPVKAERDRERWRAQSQRRGRRPYDTERWKTTAQQGKQRDGFQCIACGSRKSLQAHHDSDDSAAFYDLSRIRTLCSSCHRRAEHERRGRGEVLEGNRAPDHASTSPRETVKETEDPPEKWKPLVA